MIRSTQIFRFAALMAIASAAMLASGCSRAPAPAAAANAAPPAVPVLVAKVQVRDMPEEVRTIGNVETLAMVMLKPQVDGELIKSNIADGQDVNKGDVLFEIDPRPFQAALAEAQARLDKDQVMAADAQRAADQMAEALKGRAMSQREADKAKADADAAVAQVESDKAALDAAKLELEYCTIRAPLSGRAGAVLVKAGNVVEKNKTELVQINQVAPIYVSFAVPEQNLNVIRAQQAKQSLPVQVIIPNSQADSPPITGALSFIDNRVDQATGTIRLKATFANDQIQLWPGQFVNVVLTLSTQSNAIVAPASAVQNSQKGPFVFVVKSDNTVEQRPVTVARTVGNQSVIAQGLAENETVVTDGQLRLAPGAKIEINESATESASLNHVNPAEETSS